MPADLSQVAASLSLFSSRVGKLTLSCANLLFESKGGDESGKTDSPYFSDSKYGKEKYSEVFVVDQGGAGHFRSVGEAHVFVHSKERMSKKRPGDRQFSIVIRPGVYKEALLPWYAPSHFILLLHPTCFLLFCSSAFALFVCPQFSSVPPISFPLSLICYFVRMLDVALIGDVMVVKEGEAMDVATLSSLPSSVQLVYIDNHISPAIIDVRNGYENHSTIPSLHDLLMQV